ncbi:17-beta-hydroxysteroid dehydrogenase type 6-like [Micropterus dolomieu]|uniref:17-beta-hydroxysteroid dehydrogenase type 6-like n=1 Tax=Micropterus dolomieu TaxID=147949 RepID=UPI001E8ED96E|nr:17-beta-hydroxysteroid dehydrogenase type 6-like [Micropterus dolomieu]
MTTNIPSLLPIMYLYLLGLVVFYYLYRWVRELPRVPDKGSKYVYITGCDSGFGNLLARHLDKQGFRVIASCFTEKGEEDLKKSCSSNLITTHLDVRSKDSVAKVAATIKDKVGECGLWAVVNNAGVSIPSAPCDWLTIDDYKLMLDVNLNGSEFLDEADHVEGLLGQSIILIRGKQMVTQKDNGTLGSGMSGEESRVPFVL